MYRSPQREGSDSQERASRAFQQRGTAAAWRQEPPPRRAIEKLVHAPLHRRVVRAKPLLPLLAVAVVAANHGAGKRVHVNRLGARLALAAQKLVDARLYGLIALT